MAYMSNNFQPIMDALRRASDEIHRSQIHVWQQFIENCRRNSFSDDDICVEMKKLSFDTSDFYGVAKLLYEGCPVSIRCLAADKAACGDGAYSSVRREDNSFMICGRE
jgi:hypothetical protein